MWNAWPMVCSCPSKPGKSLGKVGIVRNHPKRRSVSRNDDLLSFQHSVDHSVGALPTIDHQWYQVLAIGKRRPDDRNRKSFLSISLEQTLFTGDLVSGIVPVWVGQRRGLGNQIVGARFLIGAG